MDLDEWWGLDENATVRRRVLVDFVEATGASAGVMHGLSVSRDGNARISRVSIMGPAELVNRARASNGMTYEEMGIDPSEFLSAMLPFGRFMLCRPEDLPPATREHRWAPIGINSSLSIDLVAGDLYLGHVSVYRIGNAPPFTSSDLEACARWIKPLEQALRVSSAMDGKIRGGTAAFVLNEDGALAFAGGHTLLWDQLAIRASLQTHVRYLAEHPDAKLEAFVEGGTMIRLLRLRGADAAFLVEIEPIRPFAVAPILALSTMSRRVAGLAALGYRVAEIAETLGRSQDTIRTHLRRVYEEAGISTRAELVQAVLRTCRNLPFREPDM